MNKILEIKNLTKYYGKTLGIKDLSLDLYEGEIFGLIGPNGAGKSTTIRSILNLINKTSGEVLFQGQLFDKDNIYLKKDIGYLPSEVNLYEELTVKEMINYHESFYKTTKKRRNDLVKRLKLDESKKIEDLSFGNKKKLGIILSLLHEPKLLILDEATSGLDPLMQQVLYELLLEEKQKGTTILYSTHILSEISKICDRVGIVKENKLLKIEEIENLKNLTLSKVTIESNEIENIIKDLKLDLTPTNNSISFEYKEDINKLLKVISKYKINNILIEEPSLEDIFFHYYK